MDIHIGFFNDKTSIDIANTWPNDFLDAICFKVDIGCHIRTGYVTVVDFVRLNRGMVPLEIGLIGGQIKTYSQFGEAMRGGISFELNINDVQEIGGNVRTNVVVYSCMKEV
jgi:hypothetical protein